MVKKSVYTLDEVMTAGEEISSIEELENVLLEQVQQAQEIIVLIEEEDYDEAREQVEAIEGKLNAIRRFIESLEGDEPSDDDTE
jgi:predicted translin family RNA/ssDNA-binding protein